MSIQEQNSAKTSQILGIDFGKSKIGLALADEETKMAFGYKILKNDKDLMPNLEKIIDDNDVNKVVVGVPKYQGESIEYEAKNFAQMLHEKFKVEIYYQEEMFTSKMAQANLIEKGVKGVKRFDDQEAARIILQEWIDNNK